MICIGYCAFIICVCVKGLPEPLVWVLKEYHDRLSLDRRSGASASKLSSLDCDVCHSTYLCLQNNHLKKIHFVNKEIMLCSPLKSASFESAIKTFTHLQTSTHQLPFQRDPTEDSVNFEISLSASRIVVIRLQPGMDKGNLKRFYPDFRFIIFVFILAGLAISVRYCQGYGKGMSIRSRKSKLEEEIRSCREDLRGYQALLIGLSEELERLKKPASPSDLDRRLCCLMSEHEKRVDEMADQVDRAQSYTDQHTPSDIHREPSFDVLSPATAYIAERGRAKLVYIEKTVNPSEEKIHTATCLRIQKNIHKPKVLNLREGRSDKHKEV